jgi:hypothetical protein
MKRALPLAVFLCVMWAATAQAHPVALGASVSPATVNMAEHVTYTLFAEWPAGWNVAPPRLPAQEAAFDVTGCGEPQITATPSGGHRLAMTCDLVVFDGGRVALPAVTVRINDPEGRTILDTIPEQTVEVIAPLVEDQPRPPKGPETLERDWRKILLIAGATVASLALAALLVWLVVRWWRRRPQAAPPVAPPEPADERALRRLADPQLDEWLRQEKAKLYYSALTEIVREYLEGRFGFPALERTTTEILADLPRVDLRGHADWLRRLLPVADYAKFAGASVPLGRWTSDRDRARQLVLDTRPVETPADTAPKGEAAA